MINSAVMKSNPSLYLGESVERRVQSMLLSEGREVYVPLVDDHGVDMIVLSRPDDAPVRLCEIQVKSVSQGGLFAAIECPDPRPEYWFVFYVKEHDTFWLINSEDFVQLASHNKQQCKNAGKYSISLATARGIRKATAKYIVNDFSRMF